MSISEQQLQQAQTLHQHGELNRAIACYQTLHQQDPHNLVVIQMLALALVQTEQLKQASTLLRQAIKKIPNESSLLNTLGNVLSRQKNYQKAQRAYEQALSITPNYPGALSNLGNCHYRQEQLADAKHCYQQALAIDSDYPDAHFNLARLLFEANELDQVQHHLQKALAIAPQHAAALGLLSSLYLQREQYQEAIKQLKKRVIIQPNHLDSYQTLATACMKIKRYPEAIAALEKVLELNPQQPEAEHQLATAYLADRQLEKALQHYLRQLEQHKTLDTLYNIGVILSDQQRHKEAIEYFQQALTINPTHFPSLSNLAALHLKNGDIAAAIATYQQALTQQPDNQEIQYILHAISGDALPTQAPAQYVSHLFDQYAPAYDKHLTEYLNYQVHTLIYQSVINHINPYDHSLKILDLGCGTGLAGQQFKPLASTLIGIDLSASMLAIAKQKNIYQKLIHAAIEDALPRLKQFDLIIAADVFPYVGDLSALFAQIHEHLTHKGLLVFSVEKTIANNFVLQKNIRYAHSNCYIETLAQQHNFTIIASENATLRKQQDKTVAGYLFILQKSSNNYTLG